MVVKRVFVAVAVPDEAKHALAAALAEWTPFPGRPVPPRNWHLTLRFIGAVADWHLDRLRAELSGLGRHPAFAVKWGGLGAFPRPARAAVLWLGVESGGDELGSVAAAVAGAVDAAGLPPEDRPFHPHLTLSRVRPTRDLSNLIAEVPPVRSRFDVSAVTMFESHLGRGGARYELLDEFPLGG